MLPELRRLIKKLQAHQANVQAVMNGVDYPIPPIMYNVGSKDGSKLVNEFIAIEAIINKIRAHGCILKDINMGLVDFLAEVDGDEVWLCWRQDEEDVAHFHELGKGFQDRKPLFPK